MRRPDSGHKGIIWNENRGKWQVQVRYNNNKRYYIGVYSSLRAAVRARNKFYRTNEMQVPVKQSDVASGHRGITYEGGKWRVRVYRKGKCYNVGQYEYMDDALQAKDGFRA